MADIGPAPPKPQSSTFLLLMVFMVTFLVILNPAVYSAIGVAMGSVLNPLIGFENRIPIATLFIASLISVTLTTYLRHLFTDWIRMGRMQEVMRAFNREFAEARRSNNLHKIKKLTERQSEVFRMQADATGGQMKPMVITMIVVIPVFAWLLLFMSAPIPFAAQASGEAIALTRGGNEGIYFVGPDDSSGASRSIFSAAQRTEVTAYGLGPGGSLAFLRNGHAAGLDLQEGPDLLTLRVQDVPAGPQNASATSASGGDLPPGTTILVLVRAESRAAFALSPASRSIEIPERATIYVAALSAPGADASGVNVTIGDRSFPIEAGRIIFTSGGASLTLTPHAVEVPWDANWDLNSVFIFIPRWILLYTLLSLPLGQVLTRALKSYDFRRQMPALAAEAG